VSARHTRRGALRLIASPPQELTPEAQLAPMQETRFTALARAFEMHLAHLREKSERLAIDRSNLKGFGEYLIAIGIDDVREVTPEIVEGYARYMNSAETGSGAPYAARSLVQRFVTVRNFFRWLLSRQVILADPTLRLRNPKVPKSIPRDLPSVEEVALLLEAPDTRTAAGFRDRAMMELIYATGLRSGEVVALDVDDFLRAERVVTVRQGKPRKDRLVPVLTEAAAVITAYIDGPRQAQVTKNPNAAALFVSQFGERLCRQAVADTVMDYRKRAGIAKPVTAMALRHALATHLLTTGLSIRHIQALLGHKSVETTTIYAKVTPLDLQRQLRRFHPLERR